MLISSLSSINERSVSPLYLTTLDATKLKSNLTVKWREPIMLGQIFKRRLVAFQGSFVSPTVRRSVLKIFFKKF